VEEAARRARLADVTVAAYARLRLRAKRRWGELLPKPEPKAGPGRGHTKTRDEQSQVSDADRKSAERARKLAAIPEQTFEAALECTDSKMSRQGCRHILESVHTRGRCRADA
jgi:hypothetical protein